MHFSAKEAKEEKVGRKEARKENRAKGKEKENLGETHMQQNPNGEMSGVGQWRRNKVGVQKNLQLR